MRPFTRKQFLQSTAGLAFLPLIHSMMEDKKLNLRLGFSTLGCPQWDFLKILQFARQHGFRGIEMRGIAEEMNLPESKLFKTAGNRKQTSHLMKEHGLSFIGFGSSANLHTKEPAARKKQLDEAKRYIDIAAAANCPAIRVFPNNFPKDQERKETLDLITQGLTELGEYANGSKVRVLMETHGDLVQSADLLHVMQQAAGKHTGLVWDISNMWTVTKESVTEVYDRLKPYIYHAHIKDATIVDGKLKYQLLGEGEVPIFEAIDLLHRDKYKGYYSFEWEKRWHPEIAEPDIAIAHYAQKMKAHFNTESIIMD